jgi:hypothetical protein
VIAAGREVVEIREFLPLRIRSFRPDVAGAGLDRDFVGSARHKETIRVPREVSVDPFQPADRRNLLASKPCAARRPLRFFFSAASCMALYAAVTACSVGLGAVTS